MNSFDQETHSQSTTTVEEADSAQAAADVPNNAEQSDLARSIHEPRTVPTNACICKLLPMRRHSRCSSTRSRFSRFRRRIELSQICFVDRLLLYVLEMVQQLKETAAMLAVLLVIHVVA